MGVRGCTCEAAIKSAGILYKYIVERDGDRNVVVAEFVRSDRAAMHPVKWALNARDSPRAY